MCGRFAVLTYDEVMDVVRSVEARLPLNPMAEWPATRPVAAPMSVAPVVTPVDGQLQIQDLTWGFSVDWRNGPVFNTRLDSALSGKGMWRDAMREGRCIVPVAAFYEPHATETVPSPRTGKPVKRQYLFGAGDSTPLLLAGVQRDGRFSIVTTDPNQAVLPVHDRMPLVLSVPEVDAWLAGDAAPLADRSAFDLVARAVDPKPGAPRQPKPAADSGQMTLF
ncbi:SOS response-associated peptidase [Slackia heliotrinireducens]|uniref:SOS response-associated peptidase n=1 Tax=Slackia heliotrinireducens TaxID=84110 RepID=UPI003315CD99